MRQSFGYTARRNARKPSPAIVATFAEHEGQTLVLATIERRKGRTFAQRCASVADIAVASARTNAQAVQAAHAAIASL